MLDVSSSSTGLDAVDSVTSESGQNPGLSPTWQRVVRQTLEAVLYEGLVDCVIAPSLKRKRDKPGWGTVYFGLGGRGYSCRGKRGGFDRVRLNIDSLRRLGLQTQAVNLAEFLRELVDALPGEPGPKRRFWNELQQTIEWSEWNDRNLEPKTDRRHLNLADLESALIEGHPYHPCFKARTGFTQSDHQHYSPEAAQAIRLQWLAVPKSMVVLNGAARTDAFWCRELGWPLWQSLRARCRSRGGDPDQYQFLPVHPWQWHNRLAPKLRLANRSILELGQPGDGYRASQSIRTLLNNSDPTRANVKLPLDIVSTSARRPLLSHGVDSAPAVSRWLAGLVADDDFFQRYPLVILEEFASARVLEANVFEAVDPAFCQFGVIWRESVEARLQPEEAAVPMTALAAVEADGKPFIEPWVTRHGVTPWLAQLFDTLVLPVWHLLVEHGVALEAHAQNSILIHTDGWPARLALRDFHESLEYVETFLAQPERAPDFKTQPHYAEAAPNEYYWMDSVEALRELYMDTLYVFHLSELAALCERFYQLPEPEFWTLLAERLSVYHKSGYADAERRAAIGHGARSIRVESLLRKKLCPHENEYHHEVRNPLFVDQLSMN